MGESSARTPARHKNSRSDPPSTGLAFSNRAHPRTILQTPIHQTPSSFATFFDFFFTLKKLYSYCYMYALLISAPSRTGCFSIRWSRNSTQDDEYSDFQVGMPKVWQALEDSSSLKRRVGIVRKKILFLVYSFVWAINVSDLLMDRLRLRYIYYCSTGQAFVYEQSEGFWEVLKTPGMCLKFSALYLSNMEAHGKLTTSFESNSAHKHSIIVRE